MVTYEQRMQMLKKSEELDGDVQKFEAYFESPTGYAISTTKDGRFLIVSTEGDTVPLSREDAYDIVKQALFQTPEEYSELHNKALEIVGNSSLYGFIAKNVVFSKYRKAMNLDEKAFNTTVSESAIIERLDEGLFKGKLIPALTKHQFAGSEDLNDRILRTMVEQIEDREKFMSRIQKNKR